MKRPLFVIAIAFVLAAAVFAEPIPKQIRRMLRQHCGDCHTQGEREGDFALSLGDVNWNDRNASLAWEHVHTMIERGIMPPPDADELSETQRHAILDWVGDSLATKSPIGGTPLRRLNRREYANTVASIFQLGKYDVPASFPADNVVDGFDNQGSALMLAGSHLESLAEAATEIADQIFPPQAAAAEITTVDLTADDLVISYSSACKIDGAMRLASRGSVTRNGTWPSKFEAPASGVYKVKLDLSVLNPPEEIPQLIVSTMRSDKSDVTDVKQIPIDSTTKKTFELEVELNRGDTIVLRYMNAPLDYNDTTKYVAFLEETFADDPTLAAAWDKVRDPARGGNGWERVKEAMQLPDLNITKFDGNEEAIKTLAKKVARDKVKSGETIVYKYFEQGPCIGVHAMQIHGPIATIRDRDQIRADQLQKKLVGKNRTLDPSDNESMKEFFAEFLSKVFRREATAEEIDRYVALVRSEADQSGSFDEGMHLAVRTVLLSPAFLYRGIGTGEMTDYEFASRLSYFLRSGPPDDALTRIAKDGKLANPEILAKETRRLINKDFADQFTRQWLTIQSNENLMPDARLGKFSNRHRKTIQAEAAATFWHIWDKNLPVTDFIQPNFVFTDAEVGWDIYALEQLKPDGAKKRDKKKRNKLAMYEIQRDGIRGGLLSMASVMMATANGVDTQPVLRGVWVLENILGSPPPEPPDAVPALTPNTSSATTVKQRLAAHMNEQSCAVCHRDIDPLGFALESFDPVGRWREHYPIFGEDADGKTTKREGQVVQSAGVLPNGTELTDVRDLKQWIADNPEIFANCLAQKLLTYATGRKLNFRERKIVAEIVKDQTKNNLRFRELVQALVQSEVFRTK